MTRTTPAFMQGSLDRLSGHRNETGRLAAMLNAAESRFAVLAGDRIMVIDTPAQPGGIRWHRANDLPAQMEAVEPLFLGLDGNGIAHFAVQAADAELSPADGNALVDLRTAALHGIIADEWLGAAAQARTLLNWHQRHRFCSNCGSATQSAEGGYKRVCASCVSEHFPRTDPVVIIAVTRGDQMLLGRSGRFSATMYSTLAGFVEPGETIEDAARREVKEETSIDVAEVSYVMSQPWPFPANLMIGLVGEATSEKITIDPDELADARWFSLDEVRAMDQGRHPEGLEIPPSISIAHHLIRKIID